jgi:hypothetical protein
MRATVSHEVIFDNTPVPEEHAVDVRPPAAWVAKPEDLGFEMSLEVNHRAGWQVLLDASSESCSRFVERRATRRLGCC